MKMFKGGVKHTRGYGTASHVRKPKSDHKNSFMVNMLK